MLGTKCIDDVPCWGFRGLGMQLAAWRMVGRGLAGAALQHWHCIPFCPSMLHPASGVDCRWYTPLAHGLGHRRGRVPPGMPLHLMRGCSALSATPNTHARARQSSGPLQSAHDPALNAPEKNPVELKHCGTGGDGRGGDGGRQGELMGGGDHQQPSTSAASWAVQADSAGQRAATHPSWLVCTIRVTPTPSSTTTRPALRQTQRMGGAQVGRHEVGQPGPRRGNQAAALLAAPSAVCASPPRVCSASLRAAALRRAGGRPAALTRRSGP